MTALEFKQARKKRRWTQERLAKKLGVSQTYIALLESGQRRFPADLARKAVRLLEMSPAELPVSSGSTSLSAHQLAAQLSALGYPGFAHIRATGRKKNPVEVLLAALAQENLEARITEALPWLIWHYADMGEEQKQWLVQNAVLRGLTNRLGFVVTLAKEAAARAGDTESARYRSLLDLEQALLPHRLEREDTLCQASLSLNERKWLKAHRAQAAADWRLLTDWRPEHLQYAG